MDAKITEMKTLSRQHLLKWGSVLGMTLLYIFGSFSLMPIMGPEIIALSGIPIAAAGWFFGLMGGITASIIAVFLNAVLLVFFWKIPWQYVDQSGLILGTLILVLAGWGSGLMKLYFNTRQRTEIQLRARERFLALLNNMTNSIIAAQDFGGMMQVLVRDLATLLEADSCYVTRWDSLREQVFPVATNIEGHPFLNMEYPKGDRNLTVSALEAGHSIVVENTSSTTYSSPRVIGQFNEQSFLSIPLIYGEHKLGAAIVGSNQPNNFSAEKLEQAEQAANQIALAIWNTQQEIELQRNLREAHALSEIALALSETERVGLDNVLQLIVASAKELIPNVEQAVIHLLDEKEQTLTYGAVIGFDDPGGGKKKMRVGEGIAGQVVLSGETLNITDVSTDPRFLKLDREPIYRSLMVTPVHSGDQKLGTISVSSNLPFAFNAGDIKLLSQLGTQAAIAIENAHLLESTQQALKEANALYRINQGLVTSLEPNELMKDTVELLQKNFGYHYVQIYVADPETGDFVMRAGSGRIGAQLKARGHRIAAGEGIVGYTAETGAPFFTNNVDDVVSFARNPLLPNTKSELAVPVKVGETILGLLDIHQMPPGYLSQRDLQLVSAVADQLAIALQKADLYESLQTSLQQEKAIRNQLMQNERLAVMGRLLATVSHELNNPLQAIQNALFLLKEEASFSPQGRQDLEIVLAESERMANMIERLRATYRPIQADDFVPTQVNNIIEDVYALISTHLRHNQILFEFNPDLELPVIPALADQIRQVVLNLLMNAVESMVTGGKLIVSTTLLRDTHEILLAISDTGKGIPADLLPNIFEAFVTNKQRGTGLGLTISYDIVMKHRGRITAENKPDEGALFRVWLPIQDSEDK
jgi:signal transduction histidine kinase